MKPLLADHADLEKLTFPVWASPKLDGIRCLIMLAGPQTRSFKPIPNHYIRGKLENVRPYLDGEILTYTNGKLDPLDVVQSKVTMRAGQPEFMLHTFDHFQYPDLPFTERKLIAERESRDHLKVNWLHHEWVTDLDTLVKLEQKYVDEQGWEGMMIRRHDGQYKHGRSTVNEQILLKMKRFFDSEAEILYAYEMQHNANKATVSALGYQERSSHQENMVPMGTLGGLWCRWNNGAEFGIGTGYDAATREYLWSIRETLPGKDVTFKFQRVGPKGAPLLPVYKALKLI